MWNQNEEVFRKRKNMKIECSVCDETVDLVGSRTLVLPFVCYRCRGVYTVSKDPVFNTGMPCSSADQQPGNELYSEDIDRSSGDCIECDIADLLIDSLEQEIFEAAKAMTALEYRAVTRENELLKDIIDLKNQIRYLNTRLPSDQMIGRLVESIPSENKS